MQNVWITPGWLYCICSHEGNPMIRRVQLNLTYANEGKLQKLDLLMDESLRVINTFIDLLWEAGTFHGSYAKLSTDTWLSARMQQCLSKQALEVVKSQRKRRKKTKPTVTKPTLNLDQRFLSFLEDDNKFDFWIRIQSLGERIILNIPSKKHKHFNHFREDGWVLRNSGRLRRTPRGWFLDVFFEKEAPAKQPGGDALGIDCGYKKLLACSDGRITGQSLEACYEKISRKKQGSAAFKRALVERDQLINRTVNELDLTGVTTVVVEDLKNVKKNSKGKIRKRFNNKLQRWTYPKVLGKLASICELTGRSFVTVDPAYTSQKCSMCGHVDKNSRQGESFLCTRCGTSLDADINAARNILMRGACSPPSLQPISYFS